MIIYTTFLLSKGNKCIHSTGHGFSYFGYEQVNSRDFYFVDNTNLRFLQSV